jgi:hypothetical protein
MKILYFFLNLWVIFTLHNPDIMIIVCVSVMFALLSLASRYVSDRSLVLLGTAVLLFSLLWHAVTIPSFEKGSHFV